MKFSQMALTQTIKPTDLIPFVDLTKADPSERNRVFLATAFKGDSAYQVWLNLGNTGTEAQFIASLKGVKGDRGTDGTNGISAYQVWLNQGNTGTEAQFIASLKGAKGDKGDPGDRGTAGAAGASAYQIWISQGNIGTEADFIASLKGPQGDRGIQGVQGEKGNTGAVGTSAYQSWINQGNSGTEAQFIASLKGAKGDTGDTGLSAYQIWLNQGNVGTEAQFIASLKGAKGDKGDPGDSNYVRPTPTPVAVGGAPAGTTFTGTISDALDLLFYPYQVPAFSAFGVSIASPLEVGASVAAGAYTFTWTATNTANIQVNTVTLRDATRSTVLASSLPISPGTSSQNVALTRYTTPATHNFDVTATNSKGTTFSRTATLTWLWRTFWGASSLATLTSANVLALTSSALNTTQAGNYAMAAGGYKWICIQSSLTQPTSFKDSGTGFEVAMNAPVTVSVTNSQGVVSNYSCYRTTNELGGSITIVAS